MPQSGAQGKLGVAVAAVGLAATLAREAAADAPLPPRPAQACSASKYICLDRDGWVSRREGPQVWRLWRATLRPHWGVQPADDGRSVVEVYAGLNLLNLEDGPSTAVLTFHAPGRSVVVVRLEQVVRRPDRLHPTVSHRVWARSFAFEPGGAYRLVTDEGAVFRFDPLTGRTLDRPLLRP